MESHAFDEAIRAMALPRRGALAGLVGLLAVVRGGSGGVVLAGSCKPTGKKCGDKAQCCSGKCKKGKCACLKDGKEATSAEVCCSEVLTGDLCGSCGAVTCADGCCGPGGCVAGTSRSNCGGNGESCDMCVEAFSGCCSSSCSTQALVAATVVTSGGLSGPLGVAVTGSNLLFVGNILAGTFSRFTRTGDAWSADGSPFTIGTVSAPAGMAAGTFFGSETLFVAERTTNSVKVLQGLGTTPVLVATIGGQGSGTGQFAEVVDVAYRVESGMPTLYAADHGLERIAVWTHDGSTWTHTSSITGVGPALGVAVDINGKVFTTSVDGATGKIMTATKANGSWSTSTYLTSDSALFAPGAIAMMDALGVFVVTDGPNQQVSVWDKVTSASPITSVETTSGSNGIAVSGSAELTASLDQANTLQMFSVACP